eukprot:211162-Alexandrium_andersonii.AAC.1
MAAGCGAKLTHAQRASRATDAAQVSVGCHQNSPNSKRTRASLRTTGQGLYRSSTSSPTSA